MSATLIDILINSSLIILCLTLTRSIILMFGGKNLFKKANKNETSSYYPILNLFVLLEIVDMSTFYGILLFIPVLNLFVLSLMSYKLSKVFNTEKKFTIGLILFPICYIPLLCYSDKQYKVSDEEYFKALDNAKEECVNLMTNEEIAKENDVKIEEKQIDSIFKADLVAKAPVGPYKAARPDIPSLKKIDDTPDETFKPIEKAEPVEVEPTAEETEKEKSKFTSELEKEEKVEILEL